MLVTGGDNSGVSKENTSGDRGSVTETTVTEKNTEKDTESETETDTDDDKDKETTGIVDISDVENKDKEESKEILEKAKINFGSVSYEEAYLAIMALYMNIYDYDSALFNLVYFDEDDVPELVAEVYTGVTMYTYNDGVVRKLIDNWGYGAGGNQGYEYAPYMGVVRNYNTEYMGVVIHETYIYIDVTAQGVSEKTISLNIAYFDDANGNGDYDEGENTGTEYVRYYLDHEEITEEKYNEYVVKAEFELIHGYYTWETIEKEFNKPGILKISDSECKKAYKEVIAQYENAHPDAEIKYNLIDFNGDNIPELVCGVKDYYVSMYTYEDGKAYVVNSYSSLYATPTLFVAYART